jgi:acyl-CoA synthetase (AMP-forming)/AMP-acid ligase II
MPARRKAIAVAMSASWLRWLRSVRDQSGRHLQPARRTSPTGLNHTEDIGRRDADAHLCIVDRTKDLVIRGGFDVYPCELEEVLLPHHEVSVSDWFRDPR